MGNIETSPKSARDGVTPFISSGDFLILAGFPFVALSSWFMSESAWHSISRKVASYWGGILSRSPEDIRARVSQVVGHFTFPATPSEISNELVANEIETLFQTMGSYGPSRWCPTIDISGEDHLKAALADGKGAILWDSHFFFASLITKIGLHSAGYALHHLSRREHGFSSTVFGMRVLNPIRTSLERRYLADRVVFPFDDPGSALKVLAERLKRNAVVSITVRGNSNRPIRVPFFDDWLAIAPGAPVLASKTGAALIPVFTVRLASGRYQIKLGPAIEASPDHSREESIRAAARSYAQQLEPHVLAYPGQWIDWINV